MGFCHGKTSATFTCLRILPVQGASVLTSRKLSSKAFLSFWKHSTFLMISFQFWCNMASLMFLFVLHFPDTSPSFNVLGMPPTPQGCPQSTKSLPKTSVEMSHPRLSGHHAQLRPPFDHPDSSETSGFRVCNRDPDHPQKE